jgi:chromosome segregation ATPase
MAGEARVSALQAEIAKSNAAYVLLSCEFRESKAALQARVKALEADLEVSKKTCKDQEYHMQQTEGAGKRATGKIAEGEASAEKEKMQEKMREMQGKMREMQEKIGELEATNAGLAKRTRELEEKDDETSGLRKRVRELEAVEAGFQHMRRVFLSQA